MRDSQQLKRDDAYMSVSAAVDEVRRSIHKISRSQAWDIEGAAPFPLELVPMLQEANRLLSRVQAKVRAHAEAHVWPARAMHVQRERMRDAFTTTAATAKPSAHG
ncbi:hypothetical protein MASR1M101_41170 [Gemmatimonas sp.]